jgi:hypothetical protein
MGLRTVARATLHFWGRVIEFFRPYRPETSAEFAREAEFQRMRSTFTGGS